MTVPDLTDIERAILQTIAYADVFDFPLTAQEIQRYLERVPASLDDVHTALAGGRLMPVFLSQENGFYNLTGREGVRLIRRRRAVNSSFLWPRAVRYGRIISRLPFVRMVAITGSLAMENEPARDMDYLIVTEPGRLWLCRGLVILLVRWVAHFGDIICPNYFLSEKALVFPDRNLYTAHELFQMVPVSGTETYWKIRTLNSWAMDFLPNANGLPREELGSAKSPGTTGLRLAVEAALRTPLGEAVETWEMNRKLSKFNEKSQAVSEANFSADWCKGHFGGYQGHTMTAYGERMQTFEAGQPAYLENNL